MAAKPILKKRQALGKGLGALLTDTNANATQDKKKPLPLPQSSINEIAVAAIETNPYQPRHEFKAETLKELSESIKVQGIIQPITVRKLSEKQYQIISGERRLQAAKMAGLVKIPVYIKAVNNQQMLEMALIENIQRENLNPIEIALSYQRLLTECSLKQETLGERVGKKRTTVANYLRLLKLPYNIQEALKKHIISMGHARAIINVENIDKQLYIFNKIIEKQLSVRKVEELVKNLTLAKQKKTPVPNQSGVQKNYQLQHIQSRLSSQLGTKVKIQADTNGKGEIKIPYYSTEDLNRILAAINY